MNSIYDPGLGVYRIVQMINQGKKLIELRMISRGRRAAAHGPASYWSRFLDSYWPQSEEAVALNERHYWPAREERKLLKK